MNKKLVLYYSLEGHTKKIAEMIAETIKADICEVKPQKEIKSTGFSKYLWGGSQIMMSKSPELITLSVDLGQYDEILLGSPIWAWTFAPPIKTILENEKFKDKKVSFFYTHGGGPKKSEEKAKEAIEKNNQYVSAIGIFDKEISENFDKIKFDVEKWLKNIV